MAIIFLVLDEKRIVSALLLRPSHISCMGKKKSAIRPSHLHKTSEFTIRRRRRTIHFSTETSYSSDDISTNQISSENNSPAHQRHRDMEPLSTWAMDWGVVLADGLQLTENSINDWTLSLTEPYEQGSLLLTVPSHVILSSDIEDDAYLPYYDEKDMRNVYTWMLVEMGAEQTTFQQNYLPEFMLIFKMIREVYLGKNSRWYDWWQSLPQTFSTGLYLDDVERMFVECMAGEFLYTQELQYKAFLGLMRRLLIAQESNAIIPSGLYSWLRESQNLIDINGHNLFESLVKWAFTVVFTRSWRSLDRRHAQIVPLGDLANHDSQMANMQPLFRPLDGAFQFYLTKDIHGVSQEMPGELYLSYGQSSTPSRYLVLFGFCDTSAAYVDAHLDFMEEEKLKASTNIDERPPTLWPTRFFDESRLVISTESGAISEEVWIAFLYRVLRQRDPDQLESLQTKFAADYAVTTVDRDEIVESLLEKWQSTLIAEMQSYYQHLLETDFAPIIVTEQDLVDHPNLSMIVKYNLFMRECFIGVLKHMNELTDDPAIAMQNMSSSPVSTSFSSQYAATTRSRTTSTDFAPSKNQKSNSSSPQEIPMSDGTMDAYAQAFNSMKLAGQAEATKKSSQQTSPESTLKKQEKTPSFYDNDTTSTNSNNKNSKPSQSENFENDSAMNAYIQAINKSNGVT